MIQMTLLLGFGLVELPRTLWRSADLRRSLQQTQAEAAREMRFRDDAKGMECGSPSSEPKLCNITFGCSHAATLPTVELRLALVDAYRLDSQVTTMVETGTLSQLLPNSRRSQRRGGMGRADRQRAAEKEAQAVEALQGRLQVTLEAILTDFDGLGIDKDRARRQAHSNPNLDSSSFMGGGSVSRSSRRIGDAI